MTKLYKYDDTWWTQGTEYANGTVELSSGELKLPDREHKRLKRSRKPGQANWWLRNESDGKLEGISKIPGDTPFDQKWTLSEGKNYTLGVGVEPYHVRLQVRLRKSGDGFKLDYNGESIKSSRVSIDNWKTERKTMSEADSGTTTGIVTTVKDDAKEAGARIATASLLQTIKGPMVKAFTKALPKATTKKAVTEFFDTPWGELILANLVSAGLQFLPTDDAKVDYIRKELRVGAMTNAGTNLLAPILGPLQQALAGVKIPGEQGKDEGEKAEDEKKADLAAV